MGCGVIEPSFLPVVWVDLQKNLVANLNTSFFHSAPMCNELGRRVLRIKNFNDIASCGRDCAAVADLTAGLAIEGSFGSEQIDFIPFDRFRLTAVATINP